MPTPVRPAIQAGNQPPLGVIDTTQPSLSAASTDVVPIHILSMYKGSLNETVVSCEGRKLRFPSAADALCFNRSRYGFVFPSKGYGSPGPIFGSFISHLICAALCFAYSLLNNPFIGSSGEK